MIIGIDKVMELKKLIFEKYNKKLHFHDNCAGQYFTFDEKIDGIEEIINEYLSSIKMKSEFSRDGLSFRILR